MLIYFTTQGLSNAKVYPPGVNAEVDFLLMQGCDIHSSRDGLHTNTGERCRLTCRALRLTCRAPISMSKAGILLHQNTGGSPPQRRDSKYIIEEGLLHTPQTPRWNTAPSSFSPQVMRVRWKRCAGRVDVFHTWIPCRDGLPYNLEIEPSIMQRLVTL